MLYSLGIDQPRLPWAQLLQLDSVLLNHTAMTRIYYHWNLSANTFESQISENSHLYKKKFLSILEM